MRHNIEKAKIAIVWPGYRKHNLHFFELLVDAVLLVCGGVDGQFMDFGQAAPYGYEAECRENLISDEAKLQQLSLASRQVFEEYHQPAQIVEKLWEAVSG